MWLWEVYVFVCVWIDRFSTLFLQPRHHPSTTHTHIHTHRLVAVIASFGGMKPKAAFRFIGHACPGYVTGPFLARLKETGEDMGIGGEGVFVWWAWITLATRLTCTHK